MNTFNSNNANFMAAFSGRLSAAKSGKVNGPNISVASISIGRNEKTVDIMSAPVLPIRGQVFFPYCAVPVPLTDESTVKLAEDAMKDGSWVILVTQINPEKKNPGSRDLYHIGVLGKVEKIIELPDGNQTALMTIGVRCELGTILKRKPYPHAYLSVAP